MHMNVPIDMCGNALVAHEGPNFMTYEIMVTQRLNALLTSSDNSQQLPQV